MESLRCKLKPNRNLLFNLAMRKKFFLAVASLPKIRLPFLLFGGAILMLFLFPGCSSSDDYDIYATIRGRITDYVTGESLTNASVVLSPSNQTRQTADDGVFVFEELDAQQYTLSVQKTGYQPNRKIVNALSGESVEVNIQLTKIPE